MARRMWTVIYKENGCWQYGGDHANYADARSEEEAREKAGETPLVHDYRSIRNIGLPDPDND